MGKFENLDFRKFLCDHQVIIPCNFVIFMKFPIDPMA